MNPTESRESIFEKILASAKTDEQIEPSLIADASTNDWAFYLESTPSEFREFVWQHIDEALKSAVLASMRADARDQLASQLSKTQLQSVLEQSNSEEIVEILDVLPQKMVNRLVKNLKAENAQEVKDSLSYKEDQLGRYVNHNVYTVSSATKVNELLEELKTHDLPSFTDSFLVVDDNNKYLGEVTVNQLLSADSKEEVRDITSTQIEPLNSKSALLQASDTVKESGRSMMPVVDDEGHLLGRFSLHDALEVFQEYYEKQVSHMGNVSDEDLFSPVKVSARRRAVWLGINLITAFMASIVIGVFDEVVTQVVALAVLMPIVASMGGITGSQTLTLTIRGLATGQLGLGNIRALGSKEVKVAFINGLLWATVVAIVAWLWFNNHWISVIIALALVINMLVASLSGIVIPVLLDKLGIDPALAGSVILTTVTDVVGFFVFLGSASLLFL